MLAAGDVGRERPTVPFLEQVQREARRTSRQALPAKLPPHHFLESRELVGISHERIEAARNAFDAVDEQPEMDARPPRDRIPWHRSPIRRRHQPSEYLEERFLRDRRQAIHRYRASSAKNYVLRSEQSLADRYAEKFLVRGEPGEVFRDRRASASSRGPGDHVNQGPVDTL